MSAAVKQRPARKLETRLRTTVVVMLQPDCEVCGKRMDGKFLRPFPGAPEKQACGHCIRECTGEVPDDVHGNR